MKHPREYTLEEVRELFLSHIWTLIDYWNREPSTPLTAEKLQGLAFSILSTLDGSSQGIPALDVLPSPHPEDKAYHQENGENWFPAPLNGQYEASLGMLHEHFHDVGRKLGYLPKEPK